MKIVCICNVVGGNNHLLPITVGKVYDVVSEHSIYYHMTGDTGYRYDFSKDFFIKIEEYRDDKLKELGI